MRTTGKESQVVRAGPQGFLEHEFSHRERNPMRILIYKRTHTGDPDANGVFGVNDCMGKIRALKYDAVIGVGGVGTEPKREGIAHKITWIGVTPTYGSRRGRSPLVTFAHFLPFDKNGPDFGDWAPETSEHFYGDRVRYLIKDLAASDDTELNGVVTWAIRNGHASSGITRRKYKGISVKCISRLPTEDRQPC